MITFLILLLESSLALLSLPYFLTSYFSNPFYSKALINSEASITLPYPFSEIIPTCLAILVAVILLSPVTMTTLIPAFLQSAMAPLDYSLGGSSIPKTPNNIKLLLYISSI